MTFNNNLKAWTCQEIAVAQQCCILVSPLTKRGTSTAVISPQNYSVVLENWIIPILNNINKQTKPPKAMQKPHCELDWETLLMFETISFCWVPEVHFP